MVSAESDLEKMILIPAGWPKETGKSLKEAVSMKLVWSDCRNFKTETANLFVLHSPFLVLPAITHLTPFYFILLHTIH